jgi:transposase-like protein
LKRAKSKTESQIKIVTIDEFYAYSGAIKKVFGYNNKTRKYSATHNRINASKGEGFNIKIERLHNSVRHRIKTFRGFHGSIYSANSIMKGFEIYYNYIRNHLAINGKTPSDLATNLQLKGNKWLELINLKEDV